MITNLASRAAAMRRRIAGDILQESVRRHKDGDNRKHSSALFDGFEKQAASIITKLKNIQPGMPKYKSGGVLAAPRTIKPGQSIAPRSEAVPLPTYSETPKWQAQAPTLPNVQAKKVMVPKPHR